MISKGALGVCGYKSMPLGCVPVWTPLDLIVTKNITLTKTKDWAILFGQKSERGFLDPSEGRPPQNTVKLDRLGLVSWTVVLASCSVVKPVSVAKIEGRGTVGL